MLHIFVTAIFIIAAVAALVSIVDSSLVARGAVADLARERALSRLGFIPQADAQELRLRRMVRRAPAKLTDGPLRSRGLPLGFAVPASDVA